MIQDFAEKTRDYFVEKTKLFFREDNVTGIIKESGKCLLIEIRVQNEIIDRIVFRFLMHKFGWNVKTYVGYFQIKKKTSGEWQTYLKSKKMCFRLPEDIEKWVRFEYDELLYDAVTQYHIFRLTDANGMVTEDKYEEFKNIIRELEENLELS